MGRQKKGSGLWVTESVDPLLRGQVGTLEGLGQRKARPDLCPPADVWLSQGPGTRVEFACGFTCDLHKTPVGIDFIVQCCWNGPVKLKTFSRIAQHHIDWQLMGGCCEGSQQGKCALLLLFCFFFLCEWLTTSCWHQSCRVGEWRPNSYWVTKQMRETPRALINGSSPRPTSQTSTRSATSTGSVPGSRERPPTGRSSNHLVFKQQFFLCNYLPRRGSMMSLYLVR